MLLIRTMSRTLCTAYVFEQKHWRKYDPIRVKVSNKETTAKWIDVFVLATIGESSSQPAVQLHVDQMGTGMSRNVF